MIRDAQCKKDWDNEYRQYEIDSLEWEQKKSEALREFDITVSKQTLAYNSGGIVSQYLVKRYLR